MDWLDRELAQLATGHESSSPAPLPTGVVAWWQRTLAGLRRDVERAASAGIPADFSETGYELRVRNAAAGLRLQATLDVDAPNLRFEFVRDDTGAAPPEGGIITLRESGGVFRPYYADQELDSTQLSETLLRPVLFPALPSTDVAA